MFSAGAMEGRYSASSDYISVCAGNPARALPSEIRRPASVPAPGKRVVVLIYSLPGPLEPEDRWPDLTYADRVCFSCCEGEEGEAEPITGEAALKCFPDRGRAPRLMILDCAWMKGVDELLRGLRAPRLDVLDASCTDVSDEALKTVCRRTRGGIYRLRLLQCPQLTRRGMDQLTRLCANSPGLLEMGGPLVAEQLASLDPVRLQGLVLNDVPLTRPLLNTLGAAGRSVLSRLNLTRCPVGPDDVVEWRRLLAEDTRHIRFFSYREGEAMDGETLCALAAGSPHLTSLDLSGCPNVEGGGLEQALALWGRLLHLCVEGAGNGQDLRPDALRARCDHVVGLPSFWITPSPRE